MRPFSTELRKAMTARGVTIRKLSLSTGLSESNINNWRLNGSLPRVDAADKLADALEWDSLLMMVVAQRTRRCARSTCRRTFVAVHHVTQRYCGKSCIRATQRAKRGKLAVAARRNNAVELRAAIAAFCQSCEPLGMCRDAECQLRGVSPLPLIQVRRRRAA